VFYCPEFDLSVGVQTIARAPFVSCFSGDPLEGSTVGVEGFLDAKVVVSAQRCFGQSVETFGAHREARYKTIVPTARTEKIHQDSSRIDQKEEYEARICCANRGRRSYPATSYGDDVGPSRSDGSDKGLSRTHPD